jgi:hypothetical protein
MTLEEHQRKAGQATSERKKITSAENGRKGGRPKGSKNKAKPTGDSVDGNEIQRREK